MRKPHNSFFEKDSQTFKPNSKKDLIEVNDSKNIYEDENKEKSSSYENSITNDYLYQEKTNEETAEKVGIPLINNGKEIWVDPSGYHNMIIGSTGSGKSQSLSFPFIRVMAKGGESMIVTDPKGELYENTANELKERGYNIIVLIIINHTYYIVIFIFFYII